MDVRYSPEQKALRDSAIQVVGNLGVSAVGQLDDAERRAKLDAAVTAAGWRDLRSADDDGNPWASGVEVAIVAEELARGCADTPFLGPTLATELRRCAGAPPATAPETVLLSPDLGALAVAEDLEIAVAPDAAGASTALVLRRRRSGDGRPGRWLLGSVSLSAPSVATDLTRPSAAPRETTVAPLSDHGSLVSVDDATRVVALALATTTADLVGSMQGAVDLAVAYAAERRQYGQPVGAFQAVQHLLADALVATEGSRTLSRHAAWAVDALPPAEAVIAASRAKAYASRAARTVCEAAIQVHGGIGNTWECLAHVHLRRALLSTDLFGGIDANLQRVLDHELTEASDGLR